MPRIVCNGMKYRTYDTPTVKENVPLPSTSQVTQVKGQGVQSVTDESKNTVIKTNNTILPTKLISPAVIKPKKPTGNIKLILE